MKKKRYTVRLRRDNGEEHARTIIAADEPTAKRRAIDKAQARMQTMADRHYARFDVIGIVTAANVTKVPPG